MVTEAMKKRNQKKGGVATNLFVAHVVRDSRLDEHPLLVRDMKRAGMTFTNTCAVTFAGLKGYTETEFGVTNSNKTRKYSNSIYLKDGPLLETILTGEMPKEA